MKRLSGLLQFLIGFVLGVSILVGGAAALAYMFLAQMNSAPPKPAFNEEKKEEKAVEKPAEKAPIAATSPSEPAKPEPVAATVSPSPEPEVKKSPEAAPSPKAEAKPAPKPETASNDEGYRARVTWQSGLSLRAEPTSQSTRVGGLDYNTPLRVVGKSDDGQWQKVQLADGREGWIKAGNVSRD
jgi:outer membrane biosynthesis protein TonB